MSRYARKQDDNHAEIRATLRAVGAWVWDTSSSGNGAPDLVVFYRGAYHLLEVKDGRKVPSARKLTPAEEKFHRGCPGPIHVVGSADDALRVIGAIRGLAEGAA